MPYPTLCVVLKVPYSYEQCGMQFVDDFFSRYVLPHGINNMFHALPCRSRKGGEGERHVLGDVAGLVTPCAFNAVVTCQSV